MIEVSVHRAFSSLMTAEFDSESLVEHVGIMDEYEIDQSRILCSVIKEIFRKEREYYIGSHLIYIWNIRNTCDLIRNWNYWNWSNCWSNWALISAYYTTMNMLKIGKLKRDDLDENIRSDIAEHKSLQEKLLEFSGEDLSGIHQLYYRFEVDEFQELVDKLSEERLETECDGQLL